jgi:hypothetical protein
VKHALTILVAVGLIACGGEPEPQPRPDHIWKSQTDMIERAGDVEGLIDESSAEQRRQLESQAQ